MNDTPECVAARYRAMLLRQTGVERLRLACRMFETARALQRASLGDPAGVDQSAAMRVKLFLRTYGQDFDAATRDRIIARLRERP